MISRKIWVTENFSFFQKITLANFRASEFVKMVFFTLLIWLISEPLNLSKWDFFFFLRSWSLWFHGNYSNNRKVSTAQCGKTWNYLSLKKNSSNQLFSNVFSKTIAFTKFLRIKCEREFLHFPHCEQVPQRTKVERPQ